MSTSIDQQFIEFVVKSLVGKPEAVKVDRRIDEKGVLLELTVDPEDLGRVIGKRGATAQSLRTLLRALGTKNDARYNLKIVDNGEGGHNREQRPEREEEGTHEDAASQAPTASAPTKPSSDDDMDDLRDADDAKPAANTDDGDRLSRTRKELEELDDLDL